MKAKEIKSVKTVIRNVQNVGKFTLVAYVPSMKAWFNVADLSFEPSVSLIMNLVKEFSLAESVSVSRIRCILNS